MIYLINFKFFSSAFKVFKISIPQFESNEPMSNNITQSNFKSDFNVSFSYYCMF